MGTIKKIQNDCRRATYLIEKGQHTPLSLKECLHLYIHLAGCGVCRLFRHQSRLINKAMRGLFQSSAGRTRSLGDEVKREMQEKIDQRLPK